MFNPGLIDTHAHLGDRKFKADLGKVLQRARDENIEHIINIHDPLDPEINLSTVLHNANLFAQTPANYGTRPTSAPFISHSVGIHPHWAGQYNSPAEKLLRQQLTELKAVALGEIGLDFYWEGRSLEKIQKEVLRRQLFIAETHSLPVILHCRQAYSDLIQILQEPEFRELTGVVHCFSGTLADAKEIVKLNFLLGIDAPITYPRSEKLQEIVREIPIEYILIETDAPYLPPQKFRGKRNEPAYIKFVAEKIAELTGLTIKDVARVTRYNARRLFHLPLDLPPEIVYELRHNLYLNITNQCPNTCWFCPRQKSWVVKGHNLKLEKEPTLSEILQELPVDLSSYNEVGFCGLGEPTCRMDIIRELVPILRQRGAKRLRLDTNGLGNYICALDTQTAPDDAKPQPEGIIAELANMFDAISISLNTSSPTAYAELCRPANPEKAFAELIKFIHSAARVFKDITITAVKLPGIDKAELERFATSELGLPLRWREFIPQT